MTDQPPSQRFKADMPQIPGVAAEVSHHTRPVLLSPRLIAACAAVVLICLLGSRWFLRSKPTEQPQAAPPPQIEVPAPAVDPTASMPRATHAAPEIATLSEMAKPWTSKDFFFVNQITGENVPAILIRLPGTPASRPDGYWALEKKPPFGSCPLEYITDLDRLTNDYDFRAAKHPMVGNPCTRSVFDPLKMTHIPGSFWVRGSLVQGSDLRPPLGVELKIEGKNIQAIGME
jgi:hypothetical protein